MGAVKYLLDTHAFLWWIGDNPALSGPAREIIAEVRNEIYLSAVSVWEISIKSRTGKLDLFFDDMNLFIEKHLRENSFLPLPVTLAHSAKIHLLSNHHRDPFDQMLVAQAQVENMSIISADKMIGSYDVAVFW